MLAFPALPRNFLASRADEAYHLHDFCAIPSLHGTSFRQHDVGLWAALWNACHVKGRLQFFQHECRVKSEAGVYQRKEETLPRGYSQRLDLDASAAGKETSKRQRGAASDQAANEGSHRGARKADTRTCSNQRLQRKVDASHAAKSGAGTRERSATISVE